MSAIIEGQPGWFNKVAGVVGKQPNSLSIYLRPFSGLLLPCGCMWGHHQVPQF